MKSFHKLLLMCMLTMVAPSLWAQVDQNRMIHHAIGFLNVPYVAHTLEVDGPEQLVANCDEVDCTTFVEYVLAMSLSPLKNGEITERDFLDNLRKIRYRDGIIDGYPSRLHYIVEWVKNGTKYGLIEDVAAQFSPDKRKVDISFMSNHPSAYKQLKDSPENLKKIQQIEKRLTGTEVAYVPEEKLPHKGLSWIKTGDIICLMTNIPGLDVSHLGIAFYVDGKLSMLHASSVEGKVVVSKISLAQMLKNSKSLIGIRVLRMKN